MRGKGLKTCYTHTVEYHSAIKKDGTFIMCGNMDGPRAHRVKGNKSEEDKHHVTARPRGPRNPKRTGQSQTRGHREHAEGAGCEVGCGCRRNGGRD